MRFNPRSLLSRNEFYLAVLVLGLVTVITSFNHHFFSFENLLDLLKSYAFFGICSIGMLFVIISGGIDISFAAIAQITEYAMVAVALRFGIVNNIFVAFIIAAVAGSFLGCINGSLVHFLRIPAIITTIATNNIFFGLLYVITKGNLITQVPRFFFDFSKVNFFATVNSRGGTYGLSIVIVIWIAVIIFGWFILRHTTFGRGVYAIGGNRVAAQRAGYNVPRTQIFIYTFMGFLAAIASVVHVLLVNSVIPNSIVGKELEVIAAVFLGGASVVGGSGTILGTILGVLLLAIMSNGLTLMRISSYWNNVLVGLVITLSVVISAIQLKRRHRRTVTIMDTK